MMAPRAELFWSHVQKTNGCWLWTAVRDWKGYGRVGDNTLTPAGNKRIVFAHRVAWELERGPIPEGLFVLHHCDNPPCVNPEHLWVGTHHDNMADMTAKGRSTAGERNPRARLTQVQVSQMRLRFAQRTGMLQKELAKEFGVSEGTVSGIVTGMRWRS